MINIAAISKEAFDAIELEIEGVVKHAQLVVVSAGIYVPESGTISGSITTLFPCRLVFDVAKPSKDIFPSYVIGPSDKIAYIEGLSTKPKETMEINIGADSFTITAVADIVGAGQLFAVVMR